MTLAAGDMAIGAHRLNLAVGLFDQVGRTTDALQELRQNSFDLTRSKLVIPGESDVFTDDAVAHLSGTVAIDRIKLIGFNVEHARSEIVVAKVLSVSTKAARLEEITGHTAVPVLARHNQRLIEHLVSGGGVLVVGLNDQTQQQTVAGMLLRLASGVFTHQLRAPKLGVELASTGRPSNTMAKTMGKNLNAARFN